jgi:hypothetical protein
MHGQKNIKILFFVSVAKVCSVTQFKTGTQITSAWNKALRIVSGFNQQFKVTHDDELRDFHRPHYV